MPHCTNMCTLVTSALPSSARICVLWPLHPYLQCTNMCTLVSSTLPFSAQMCVLWPLQPYLSVHKYVYFGHFSRTFQCTNMCTSAASALPFSAQICVLWPLKVNLKLRPGLQIQLFSCASFSAQESKKIHFYPHRTWEMASGASQRYHTENPVHSASI
jgi:hypothetical protein